MKEGLAQFWDNVVGILEKIQALFTTALFKLGDSEISLSTILYMLIAFIVLNYVAKKSKSVIVEKVLAKANLEKGASATIGTISKFLILLIGSIIIIQSAGIDLSALSLLAGALGVGIGFGLQNITDNFISGIIILLEKPIKVGDRIEVGSIAGDVIKISVRATTVQTNDNISIIVPNSEFISQTVINWSHNDRNIRFRFPVGVSYKEEPEKVKKVLLEVAAANPNVLTKPAPQVLFDEFADSSLNFYLAVWTTSHTDKPNVLKSELYFEIFRQFAEKGIEIPYPQRDIYVKENVLAKETQPKNNQDGQN